MLRAMPTDAANREGQAIARRAGTVAAGTLASRVLGMVRDAVFAAAFAVGATDAFFMAWTIPNALRVLLGEGAISGAFVPVFTEAYERDGPERARAFYARLVGTMGMVLLAVATAGVIAAPGVVWLYAAGYSEHPELFDNTVVLTRVVFPYIFLMGVSALATGALYARKRFVAPAFAPMWLNVAFIAAAFGLAPFAPRFGVHPIIALGVGALIGGVLQILVQLRPLHREGLLVRPRLPGGDPYVHKSLRLLLPLLAGLGVYQLNIVLARQLTSFLPKGSLSYLYYGQRLVELPQGMFAVAIASAALPSLSESVARGDTAQSKHLFRYALRLTLFVAVPSTVALALLAEPTVAVIFGRGAYRAHEIEETARSLVWQAAGIWAVASVRTVVPMFHAYNDTRTPVVASAVNLVTFGGLAAIFMGPMQHAGLALAVTGAAVTQLATLIGLLRWKMGRLGLRELATGVARMSLASAAMGAVIWLVARYGAWERGANATNVAVFTIAVAAGGVTYLAVSRSLGAPELDAVVGILRRRRRKA